MAVAIELLKFAIILLCYLAVGTFVGGFIIKFILSKFKIKVKDTKKIYLIPIFVYILAILSQVLTSYVHQILGLVILLLILYLVYYFTKTYFKIKTNKKAIYVSAIWILSFIVANFILGIVLIIVLGLLNIPIVK